MAMAELVSTRDTSPLLSCDLSVRYGSGTAGVSGIRFDLRRGEIFGVAGESGSGKSTIAMALMGLLEGDALRRPLLPLPDDARAALALTLRSAGLVELRGGRISQAREAIA